jgi:hypothetical protein
MGSCRIVALVLLGFAASCSSPSAPTSPSTDPPSGIAISVTPKRAARALPEVLEATIQSFRPFVWTTGWTVTIRDTNNPQRPIDVRSVSARIEAEGRTLASTITLSPAADVNEVRAEQSLTWETPTYSPPDSQLVVTAIIGARGSVTATNVVRQNYCGGRAQAGCQGPFISFLRGGRLLLDDGKPEWTVWVGQTATFFNGDSVPHLIRSDPHPQHTDCDALSNSTEIAPPDAGNSYYHTLVFNREGTCGFHDEHNPTNTAAHGRIIVRCCIF